MANGYHTHSKGVGLPVPDLTNIEEIKPEEALKDLEPLLKAFNAFGSLYKIISLTIRLNGENTNLTLKQEELKENINKLIKERNDLDSTQEKVLNDLKIKHDNNIKELTNNANEILNKVNKLKQQEIELTKKLEIQTKNEIEKCNMECNEMILKTNMVVEKLQLEADKAEARLNKANKEFNLLKAKLG